MNKPIATREPVPGLRRRHLGALLVATCLPGWAWAQTIAKAPSPLVQVWKDPNCGCCKDWIAHMEKGGFRSQTFDVGNTAMRARLGMPQQLGSCHTALIDGYVIEGHVPASDIQRLLKERPKALGLSVPRMPVGSPGMDGPAYGGRKDPFEVLLVDRDGTTAVFSRYN
ncbi:hypothetical protein LPB72_16320 [Hydrogenophaga crassostreae]|uniref:Metal-binding protein n=1 Tax=Hydrogenophaga crassostreae TaxID=1763535 RepID=A0A167H850_9BURK|nr:DUF411 domain-containing protein [Hydrogenophaga crassostreae]AOW12602.1 hypothetical protein LPB072_06835 [Hydrogenophaga crassostreae]OAD40473.1 hypothetical protein LPB72_16320 [Hydrogenophaga crassostreae]